jgi:putative spermidine/putrescine transport system substrate-binding protein
MPSKSVRLGAILILWSIAVGAITPSVALAQSGPGVVMAAYGGGNGDTWRETVGKPFAKATGIPVQITDLPNTETPIRAQAGNPQYNVAWVGYFQAAQLYKDGLIETFDQADFPELKNVPEKFLLKTPDGKLTGIPVQFQYYGIAFNTKEAKASDFPSWMSLTEPKWKGKLAQGQAFVAASYDLVMYAHIAGGSENNIEPGIPAFTKFSQNCLTVMTSFAQGNTLLSRGEVAATPFYSGRVRALKKDNAPVDIVIPKEGAILLPYILVVPKGAKNRDALMQFLKYATEAPTQLAMYDYSGYIPFNLNAKLNDKQVAELGMPLNELGNHLYLTDFWALAENMKKNTEIAEKIQAGR